MEVRAAVAHKAGEPLSIETVQLEGPKAGEVMVEIKATGICHTDEFTLSGGDPEGSSRPSSGMRGRAWWSMSAPECVGQERRPRDPAVHAGMPAVRVLPQPEDQSLPGDPGDPGSGPDARRDLAVLAERHQDLPLHGHLDLRQLHGPARDRGRQDPEDAPFDKVCYIGCGVTTGIGAVLNTAKVEAGANVVVFGLGGIGLNVIQGRGSRPPT